ncbi:MAG: CBO0543 family protein [Syntrophomonadaceae bacterium]
MQQATGLSNQDLISSIEQQLTHLRIQNWLHHDLFTWQWWLLLAVLTIPWYFWWKRVDRTRLLEITLIGMLVFIISSYLDAVLSELGLWEYHYWVIPLWPRLIPADWSVLPITYMFVYQKYSSSWKRFIIAMTVTSALYSFGGESFLVWIDVYELHSWRHYYSFPIYLAIGILIKWVVAVFMARQEQARAG